MKIKSIAFDYFLIDGLSNLIPAEQNTLLQVNIQIGDVNQSIAATLEHVANQLCNNTGNFFTIYSKGQWLFDSFYVSESLPVSIRLVDAIGAVNGIGGNFDLVIEVEENINY